MRFIAPLILFLSLVAPARAIQQQVLVNNYAVPTPTPTATPSPTPTPSPTATPSPTPSPTPGPDPNPITLTYVSDGDTNDILYFVGQNYSTGGSWVNPYTATRVDVVMSSADNGGPVDIVDRATGNVHTSDIANSWIAIDFGSGKSVIVSKYSLQNRPFNDRAFRNGKLQGSNDPVSNSVGDLAAATWVDIDVRSADTTMPATANAWGTYTPNQGNTNAYRWIRVIQTGLNSGGDNYFTSATEIQLYGTFSY